METLVIDERLQADALLDMLTHDKLNVVRGLLEVMIEPAPTMQRSLSFALAPVDDEEFGPETAAALDRASLAHRDDILREFPLQA